MVMLNILVKTTGSLRKPGCNKRHSHKAWWVVGIWVAAHVEKLFTHSTPYSTTQKFILAPLPTFFWTLRYWLVFSPG